MSTTRPLILDGHNQTDLNRAAQLLVEGKVLIAPICGVMGFVCDATQKKAVNRVYALKNRDRTRQLITAGSSQTRKKLIDFSKLHQSWTEEAIDQIYELPTFIIFPSSDVVSQDFTRPDDEDPDIPTVAIWWANHYQIMTQLETLLQKIKPDAFIGGSSCNVSQEGSITDSKTALAAFGKKKEVAAIIYDKHFDQGLGLIKGSHGMLKVAGDRIKPHRAGSVHIDSFRPILGNRLNVQKEFKDLSTAVLLDYKRIAKVKHYLR